MQFNNVLLGVTLSNAQNSIFASVSRLSTSPKANPVLAFLLLFGFFALVDIIYDRAAGN